MSDPENNIWLRHQLALLSELESYERMLKDDRDRKRPAYLTLIKNQEANDPATERNSSMRSSSNTGRFSTQVSNSSLKNIVSSGFGGLPAAGQKKVVIVEPGARELRESVVAELMSLPSSLTPLKTMGRKSESPRGPDPVLLSSGIGKMIH
jgi:hypothetical protein